jgi:hypothetical protein
MNFDIPVAHVMNHMALYTPHMRLVDEDGKLVLYAVLHVPHSCFLAGTVSFGAPQGFNVIPEGLPVSFNLERSGNRCLPVVTSVLFKQEMDPQSLDGRSMLVGFAVLKGDVLGSNHLVLKTPSSRGGQQAGAQAHSDSFDPRPFSDSFDPWPYMGRGII